MTSPQRAVFITGAAAGIGRATALTFARRGFTVGAYDIDEVGLKTLADDIDQIGGTAITGHLDVTDTDEMAQRVGEFARAAGDRLDVMINNAGILLAGRFEDLDTTSRRSTSTPKGSSTACTRRSPTCARRRTPSSSISPPRRRSTVKPSSPTTARPSSSSAASPKPSTSNGTASESG
jgi:NAD(P)-dependent dehydrogenase (short-subunit alcohol dehydrogenase family)